MIKFDQIGSIKVTLKSLTLILSKKQPHHECGAEKKRDDCQSFNKPPR